MPTFATETSKELADLMTTLPQIKGVSSVATKDAEEAIKGLQTASMVKSMQMAAYDFAKKGETPIIREYGQKAADNLAKKKPDQAGVYLQMAKTLTNINSLSEEEKTKSWVTGFNQFATTLRTQELEDKAIAYSEKRIALANGYAGIAKDAEITKQLRIKATDYVDAPGVMNRITQATYAVEDLYRAGNIDGAKKLLGYASTYEKVSAQGNKTGMENLKNAVESATNAAGEKDSKKAAVLFKSATESYGQFMEAKAVESVKKSIDEVYSRLEKYAPAKEETAYDKMLNSELQTLKSIYDKTRRQLTNQPEKAEKLVNTFFEESNKFFSRRNADVMDRALENVGTVHEDVEELKKVLVSYHSAFRNEVVALVAKLDNLGNTADNLAKEIVGAKAKQDSKLTEKLEKKAAEFSKEKKTVYTQVQTAVLVMSTIEQEKQFDSVLKTYNIGGVLRAIESEGITETQKKILDKLNSCLNSIVKDGPNSEKARNYFETAVENKTRVMAMLRLRETISLTEAVRNVRSGTSPTAELSFFTKGWLAVYDAYSRGDVRPNNDGMLKILGNVETSLRTSEKVLVGLRDSLSGKKYTLDQRIAGTESSIIRNANQIVTALASEKTVTAESVIRYSAVIDKDAETLKRDVEAGRTIKSAFELVASFHPIAFAVITVKNVMAEYETVGKIPPATAAIIALSFIALRHAPQTSNISAALEGAYKGKVGAAIGYGEAAIGLGLGTQSAYTAVRFARENKFGTEFWATAAGALPVVFYGIKGAKTVYSTSKNVSERLLNNAKAKIGAALDTELGQQAKFFFASETGAVTDAPLGLKRIKEPTTGQKIVAQTKEQQLATKIDSEEQKKKTTRPTAAQKPIEKPYVPTETTDDMYRKYNDPDIPDYVIDDYRKWKTEREKPLNKASDSVFLPCSPEGFVENGIKKYLGIENVNPDYVDMADAIVQNGPHIKQALQKARDKMLSKDNSSLYKALNGQIIDGARIAEEVTGMELAAGTKLHFKSIDAGGTWISNAMLGREELGNLKLFIYFEATNKVKGKFAGITQKMTERGDELGAFSMTEMKGYETALRGAMEDLCITFGINGKLRENMLAFSTEDITATVVKDQAGKLALNYKGKVMTLDNIISRAEAEKSIDVVKEVNPRAARTLENFLDLMPPKTNVLHMDKLAPEIKVVEHKAARLEFAEPESSSLGELTTVNGKGTPAVRNKIAGPSVLNQAGHPTTDFYTNHMMNAYEESFRNNNIPTDTLCQSGPLIVGYTEKIKSVSPAVLKKAEQEAEALFQKKIAETGVAKVRIFSSEKKDAIEHKITEFIAGREISTEGFENMRKMTAVLHLNPTEFLAEFPGLEAKAVDALKSVEKEKWTRGPADLIDSMRTRGLSDAQIWKTFDVIGIK